jgi:hypothetical protein
VTGDDGGGVDRGQLVEGGDPFGPKVDVVGSQAGGSPTRGGGALNDFSGASKTS